MPSKFKQTYEQPIEISTWIADSGYEVYPEGARDKSLLRCPSPPPYSFLTPNFRYLFKQSFDRYPEQYWVEIIAYRLGIMLQVPVPPAFVAFDKQHGVSGALIKWFYDEEKKERYIPGGDLMQAINKKYDRKKGTQHNFQGIIVWSKALRKAFLQDNWLQYWSKVLLFDSLLGNTDRHQDNWGIIWRTKSPTKMFTRFAPAFDNGTSSGHEILEEKIDNFYIGNLTEKYVKRGTHHLKWDIKDSKRPTHAELLLKVCKRYPEAKHWMLSTISKYSPQEMEEFLVCLTKFEVPIPLSLKRAMFILHLTSYRCHYIQQILNNN